MKANGQVAV